MSKGHCHKEEWYDNWRHSTNYEWTVVTQPMIEQLNKERCNKQCSSFDIPGATSEYRYDVNLFELIDTETDAEGVKDLTIPINRNDNFIMRTTIPIPYLAKKRALEELEKGVTLSIKRIGGVTSACLSNGSEVGRFIEELESQLLDGMGSIDGLYAIITETVFDESIPYFRADIWRAAE